jgi:hypothetical protein
VTGFRQQFAALAISSSFAGLACAPAAQRVVVIGDSGASARAWLPVEMARLTVLTPIADRGRAPAYSLSFKGCDASLVQRVDHSTPDGGPAVVQVKMGRSRARTDGATVRLESWERMSISHAVAVAGARGNSYVERIATSGEVLAPHAKGLNPRDPAIGALPSGPPAAVLRIGVPSEADAARIASGLNVVASECAGAH